MVEIYFDDFWNDTVHCLVPCHQTGFPTEVEIFRDQVGYTEANAC